MLLETIIFDCSIEQLLREKYRYKENFIKRSAVYFEKHMRYLRLSNIISYGQTDGLMDISNYRLALLPKW